MNDVSIPPGEDVRAELSKQLEIVLRMSDSTGPFFDVLFDARTRLKESNDANEELAVTVWVSDRPRIVDRARNASVTWDGPLAALATDIYYVARS